MKKKISVVIPILNEKKNIVKLVGELKKNINKDEIIKIGDVELNLPKEVIEARDYQYNLI